VTTFSTSDHLAEALEAYPNPVEPRAGEIARSAIKHLHAFVEDVGVTRRSGFRASSSSQPWVRCATTNGKSSSFCLTPSACRCWST